MSSATDELRRLLDERGAEWMDDSYAQLWCTVWHGQDGKQWRMTENQSGMLTELKAWQVTPEQAIAATLGNTRTERTCHNASYRLDESRFHCSVCGFGCWVRDVSDGRDKLPNYCPNCGAKVIGGDA